MTGSCALLFCLRVSAMKGHLALYARQPVPLPTTCSRARIEICDSSSPVRSIKGAPVGYSMISQALYWSADITCRSGTTDGNLYHLGSIPDTKVHSMNYWHVSDGFPYLFHIVTDVDGTGSASKDALRYMILSIHSLMGFDFNLFAILVPAENASFCPNAYAFRCMLELLFLTTCLRTAAS